MLIKTKGIIFRTLKYSETSIIADIYTEEKGLRTYIISGVRSKKAKVSASLLQLMSLVDMVVYHRDNKEMCRIKEIKSACVYQSIPFDVLRGAIGMFMIELVQKVIREREENVPLFEFLYDSFVYLDTSPHAVANLHLTFMLELTTFLGFVPNGKYESKTPFFDLQEGIFTRTAPNHTYFLKEDICQLFSQFLHHHRHKSHEIAINREQRKTLLNELITFYRFHVEGMKPLNAHVILQEVLD